MSDDPLSMIDEFEPMRETLRGIVAMFVADGFTDDQARELAVAVFVSSARASA
jgi:hypothetical protein